MSHVIEVSPVIDGDVVSLGHEPDNPAVKSVEVDVEPVRSGADARGAFQVQVGAAGGVVAEFAESDEEGLALERLVRRHSLGLLTCSAPSWADDHLEVVVSFVPLEQVPDGGSGAAAVPGHEDLRHAATRAPVFSGRPSASNAGHVRTSLVSVFDAAVAVAAAASPLVLD